MFLERECAGEAWRSRKRESERGKNGGWLWRGEEEWSKVGCRIAEILIEQSKDETNVISWLENEALPFLSL